jgi:putative transposase
MSLGERRARIEAGHPKLSLSRQCRLLRVSRSSLYHKPKGESEDNRALMRRLDELFMAHPFYGSRQMVRHLRREGVRVGRHRVRRLMRLMGLEAIYQAPRTSRRHPAHRVYPYLLKGVAIERPGHVWSADITYIPVQKGFLYLVAVMDWATRRVLSWRLSNTLDARFCTDALTEALERYGCPEIFNTDQGSQFTSQEFTSVLNESGVAISMDGRGRCMDNVFVERLWRSIKYEEVYLKAYQNGTEARKGIGAYLAFYNQERPHQALGYRSPGQVFQAVSPQRCLLEHPRALPSDEGLRDTPAVDSLILASPLS